MRGRRPARTGFADEGGFTVVEGLVAAFVLVVGLLATVTIFNSSRNQGATAERDQTAVGLASAELESIRALPYDQIALSANPSPSGDGEVLDRVQGDKLEIRGTDLDGDGLEFLVAPVTGVTGAVAPVTTGVDVGGEPMDVYRFVSWRDEECPVLPLEQISDVDVSGVSGRLTAIVNPANFPLVWGLISGTLNSVVSRVNDRVLDQVEEINETLDNLQDALEAGIDLCDADLAAVEELATEIAALQTAIETLNTSLDQLDAALGQILTLSLNPLGLVTRLLNLVNGAVEGAIRATEQVLANPAELDDTYVATINGLITTVQSLGADTEENTKRITVAVVPRDRAGAGPFDPVWVSTVVTDPNEGIG